MRQFSEKRSASCRVRLRRLLSALLVCFPPLCLSGQPASLVRDITPNAPEGWYSSNPTGFAGAGSLAYFFALETQAYTSRLWRTDGTPDGTQPVKEVAGGSLTFVGPTLFFSGGDNSTGTELWKSDGTAAGTVLVRDIRPGYDPSGPQHLTAAGATLYFTAVHDASGVELWRSDGTEAGTTLVKDIVPGSNGSDPQLLTNVNGTLFFFPAYGGATIADLWKSDGTASGTILVKSMGSQNLFSLPTPVALVNKLVFGHCDASFTCGVWASDGTAPGTVLLKTEEYQTLATQKLFVFQGAVYFTDVVGGVAQLWKTDGTPGGTVFVEEVAAFNFAEFNDRLYFLSGYEPSVLWKSDGTTAGTFPLKALGGPGTAEPPRAAGALLYIPVGNEVSHSELWKSDGTADGTGLVEVICDGTCFTSVSYYSANFLPKALTAVNDVLVFQSGSQEHGSELWVSDGTSSGTRLLRDINPEPRSTPIWPLFAWNGIGFFAGDDGVNGYELWKSDGTAAGTNLVKDINPPPASPGDPRPTYVGSLDHFALISASDGGSFEPTLWRTDGTEAGTVLVKDINPTTFSAPAGSGVRLGDSIYFGASGGPAGSGLWKSDGTTEGTTFVRDPAGAIFELTRVGDGIFFAVIDGLQRCSLWKSDGTHDGTVRVKELNSSCVNEWPAEFTVVGNLLFFSAYDTIAGQELWKSDGTEAGTARIKDIRNGTSSSNPAHLTVVDGVVYFAASASGSINELWRSDGTADGTFLVKDINVTDGSYPDELTEVDGTLFFRAHDAEYGHELWKSDGTPSGTIRVRDIETGPAGAFPTNLTKFGGKLIFGAADDTRGRELWQSDGTPEGTSLLQEIRPGAAGSGSLALAHAQWLATGSRVFFLADDGATGFELWSLRLPAPPPPSTSFHTLTPCRVVDTRLGPLFGGPGLAAGIMRAFGVAGRCGIPPTARSVSANLTIVGPTQLGHLTVWPAGASIPLASSINFRAGQVRANNAIVPLGDSGAVWVISGQASGTVDFILDVSGYFE